jgi:heavy metal translocating P-type ATPase
MSGACEYRPDEQESQKDDRRIDIIRLVATAAVSIFIAWLQLLQPAWLGNLVIILTVAIAGYPLFKESFHALRKGRVNMELSMVIAIVASLALYQFLPAVVITLFALLSEFIEGFIVGKGRQNIQLLYDKAPRKAIVIERNDNKPQAKTVEIEQVNVGDLVLVREGDIISIDGHIVKGFSSVDQSSITGESIPVEKTVGDAVFAGTMNLSSQIEVVCDKPSSDTTFAKIIHLVEEAEASKAPIQRLSDKMAARIIQFAIGLSVLTYLVTQNVTSTLSVVVVAGACGLAVGTPIAVLATIGKFSKKGLIVKGGVQVELLKNAGTVVFDKTGTLTHGRPAVSQVISFKHDIEPVKVLEYAAIAEKNINHPLAKAVEQKAHEANITANRIPDASTDSLTTTSAGKGVTRIYNGRRISVGNLKFVEELSLERSSASGLNIRSLLTNSSATYRYLREHKEEYGDISSLDSATLSFVMVDREIIGVLLFEDKLREEAKEALRRIKAIGIHTVMLTGDNERVAKKIAEDAGIDEYHANLLPHDKVTKIEDIVRSRGGSKKTVVMVGDGINDAPALAKSDVGIAMGRGTDVAIETADVVLMTEDLLKIPYAIRISRQSIFAVYQNFFGTIFIDGLGFVLAITGNINPLIAAFMHVVSEIIFIVNSARLVSDKSMQEK